MNADKYKQYPIPKRRYPGDFGWVTFYSSTNEAGIKADDFIRRISECTTSETINLSGNNLYKNPILLEQSVRSVQDSAHTIDLSFNNLHKLSKENWAQLNAAFPAYIVEVNLSGNKLGQLEFTSFQEIINNIPSTVSDILLFGTTFNYPEAEFQAFMASHGNRIKIGDMPEEKMAFSDFML